MRLYINLILYIHTIDTLAFPQALEMIKILIPILVVHYHETYHDPLQVEKHVAELLQKSYFSPWEILYNFLIQLQLILHFYTNDPVKLNINFLKLYI